MSTSDSDETGASMEMPSGNMNEGDQPEERLVEAIDRNVSRLLDDVVDQALERISDEDERQMVREGVAEQLRRTLTELAGEELDRHGVALAGPMGGNGAGAVERGMEVASRVQDLGFVEFTTGLINGTFDALINSTIRQMEAYGDLLADIAKGIDGLQAESVGEAEIDVHLSDRYPDDDGGTVVRPSYRFVRIDEDAQTGRPEKTAAQQLRDVAAALAVATRDNPDHVRLTIDDSGGFGLVSESREALDDDEAQAQFTLAQVKAVRTAVAYNLAAGMLDRLEELARQGMARIVVTDGEIFTRLTFDVSTTDRQETRESQTRRSQFGGGLRVGGFARNLLRTAGLHGGLGFGGNRVTVNTATTTHTSLVEMDAQIYGHVRINFRSDFFPAAEVG